MGLEPQGRRNLALVLVIVGAPIAIAVAGLPALARGSARPRVGTVTTGSTSTQPTQPPTGPSLSADGALMQTEGARFLVIRESTGSEVVTSTIDNVHHRAEQMVGGTIISVQIGRIVYKPKLQGNECFTSTKSAYAFYPNVSAVAVGSLFPSNVPGIRYTITSKRTIKWTVPASGYRPHGSATVDSSFRIVSTAYYGGPGTPLTGTIQYPLTAPSIGISKLKLCPG